MGARHSTKNGYKEVDEGIGGQIVRHDTDINKSLHQPSGRATHSDNPQVWTDRLGNKIVLGDSSWLLSKILEPQSVDLIYTQPAPFKQYVDSVGVGPLRDRFVGTQDQPLVYLERLVDILGYPARRVLKDRGHLFVDIADYYDEVFESFLGIPEMFFTSMLYGTRENLEDDDVLGWFVSDKPRWQRSNKDLYQKSKRRFKWGDQPIYHFTKLPIDDYYFNHRSNTYWTTSIWEAPINFTEAESGEFASGYPEKLIEIAIETCCPPDGIVLDPMSGTGTVGKVAKRLGRKFIMLDLSLPFCEKMANRILEPGYWID